MHLRWNRKANGHREQNGGHRDDRLWSMGLFWTTKATFSFDLGTGLKIEFTPAPGGWDLISAKKRAGAVSRDYGAITDTDVLVRIMGGDPFRRAGFSL